MSQATISAAMDECFTASHNLDHTMQTMRPISPDTEKLKARVWREVDDANKAQAEAYQESKDASKTTMGANANSPKDFLKLTHFNAAALMQQDFPPMPNFVEGIISTGLVLLVAAPKIGKSWMVLDLSHKAAVGGKAFGSIRVRKRPVAYFALEDGPRRLQNRMKKLGINPDEAPDTFEFYTSIPSRDPVGTISEWLDRHSSERPLVVLDTLGKVKGMCAHVTGETDFDRDYRLMGGFKEAVDAVDGATLIVVHHTRKMESSDFLDSVSGTNGIAGAADTILKIERKRTATSGTLSVTSRDAAEGEYGIEFDKDTGLWTLQGGSLQAASDAAKEARQRDGVGDTMADICLLVSNNPRGIKPFEVAEQVGISPSQASQYLGRAAKAGRILNPRRGLYAPLEYSNTPLE